MKRVALHTLGCKLNYAETSTIGRQFTDRGFELVSSESPFDVFVLNTCSVTERAERECRQLVRRALRTSPEAYVVVVGCYAQLRPEELSRIEGVDLVLGSREKFRLFDYIADPVRKDLPQVFVSCIDESNEIAPAFAADAGQRTRAFLKIQDGCDYKCAFCTIPRARGESRSLSPGDVLRQARDIAAQGFKEIVLTGVNVGDYGKKIGSGLLDLLRGLETIDGIERIRISSIEPNLLTADLIGMIAGSPRLCSHFHVPLQSGSDTVLALMRRRYPTSVYRRLVETIREKDPGAGIGADVIVGFPGETDELFEETFRFLVELPVSYLHVFTYSERPGTPASAFGGSVDRTTRARRSEMLRNLSRKKRRAFYSSFVGRTLPVLLEGEHRRGRLAGLTSNYIRVESPGSCTDVNTLKNVTILGIDDDMCYGTPGGIAPPASGHAAVGPS